jgi:DUF2934 family protein
MEKRNPMAANPQVSQLNPVETSSMMTVPARARAAQSLSQHEIGTRAYQKWEAAGKPIGKDLKFWLEAQRELSRAKQYLADKN